MIFLLFFLFYCGLWITAWLCHWPLLNFRSWTTALILSIMQFQICFFYTSNSRKKKASNHDDPSTMFHSNDEVCFGLGIQSLWILFMERDTCGTHNPSSKWRPDSVYRHDVQILFQAWSMNGLMCSTMCAVHQVSLEHKIFINSQHLS